MNEDIAYREMRIQGMRILIVDDENLARERLLRIFAEQFTQYEIVGEAKNGVEALEKVQSLKPNLVILDIRMPGMDGLEVARHLRNLDNPPLVIFSTAYDEHAMDAFRVNAIDYLLKPVRSEQLEEALSKAAHITKSQLSSFSKEDKGQIHRRKYISARNRLGITLVPIENIYYFRAEHKYVNVRHKDGEELIEDPLKELEEEFATEFIRVHRNALVAPTKIRGLEKNVEGMPVLKFVDIPDRLEVSRRHVSEIRTRLRQGY